MIQNICKISTRELEDLKSLKGWTLNCISASFHTEAKSGDNNYLLFESTGKLLLRFRKDEGNVRKWMSLEFMEVEHAVEPVWFDVKLKVEEHTLMETASMLEDLNLRFSYVEDPNVRLEGIEFYGYEMKGRYNEVFPDIDLLDFKSDLNSCGYSDNPIVHMRSFSHVVFHLSDHQAWVFQLSTGNSYFFYKRSSSGMLGHLKNHYTSINGYSRDVILRYSI